MDKQIVDMLRGALEQAERGEIRALAVIAVTGEAHAPAVQLGYLERDMTTEMERGATELLHQLIVKPQFTDAMDEELPARALSPL